MVGLGGLEPPTSRLSGVRSNQLSYRPIVICRSFKTEHDNNSELGNYAFKAFLLRKEVIHPHVPVGIPCYDLTPVISSTLGASLLCRLG